jgi:hypothetical protein
VGANPPHPPENHTAHRFPVGMEPLAPFGTLAKQRCPEGDQP